MASGVAIEFEFVCNIAWLLVGFYFVVVHHVVGFIGFYCSNTIFVDFEVRRVLGGAILRDRSGSPVRHRRSLR